MTKIHVAVISSIMRLVDRKKSRLRLDAICLINRQELAYGAAPAYLSLESNAKFSSLAVPR